MKNIDITNLISDIETTIIKTLDNVEKGNFFNLPTLNSKITKLYSYINNVNPKINNNEKNNFKLLLCPLTEKIDEIESHIKKNYKFINTKQDITPQSAAQAYKK